MLHRPGWALSGALALIAVLALARATNAGPLDPVSPPAPTMRTLRNLVPTWSLNFSSVGGCVSERWQCVMNDEAILDKETGVTWQRVPVAAQAMAWDDGNRTCAQATTGGRMGWRLPTVYEATSLLDPAVAPPNKLPVGHPFTISVAAETEDFLTASSVSSVGGHTFLLSGVVAQATKTLVGSYGLWCVRGVGGEDND